MDCPNRTGQKCQCPACLSRVRVEKAREDYKHNAPLGVGIVPEASSKVERMFWAVTWKHTVEHVSATQFAEEQWIINRFGRPENGVYSRPGVDLFDTEAKALWALALKLERERDRLNEWIAALKDRMCLVIDGG